MSIQLRDRILGELDRIDIVDPHTHIDARQPAARDLSEILGYHYYTELAHSAGMPREEIERPGLSARDKVAGLMSRFDSIDNTIQYSWFVEMMQELFELPLEQICADNWQFLYEQTAELMAQPDWLEVVWEKSRLRAVFLTNDFDDPLEGFDTRRYIPCLRVDELVFRLHDGSVRQRLAQAVGSDQASLRPAVGALVERFVSKNAKACAVSLPPDFTPQRVDEIDARKALDNVWRQCDNATDRQIVAHYAFWTVTERCAEFRLPLDLMIGVNRRVYQQGVYQGQDLFDSRVSLIQYQQLFNAFPQVTFPVSVLASSTNQELASYAWIFPNVVTSGHWWYSNTPALIEQDLAVRLETVPRTKQIGYYSDMYKMEFALPKFNMYKRTLAKVLADRFVVDRGWSEKNAVQLGYQILRDNVQRIFDLPG